MATEVRDIVTDALVSIGVLAAGEVPTADEATDSFRALNQLLDQWAAERLMVYALTRTTWTIASGTQSYDVGTGQTVNVARPTSIDRVAYTDSAVSPVAETPLDKLTWDAWAAISQKSLTSDAPTAFWFSPVFPYGSIKLWPVPTSSTLTGVLYAPQQVSEFASLDTAISLPPGYRRMLVKNLAVELCPSYERSASRELVEQAADAVRVVKRSNAPRLDLSFEFTNCGAGFDIQTGE